MPTPSNAERDHQKIGETILLCVRNLPAQSGEVGVARVLILGSLHEVAERIGDRGAPGSVRSYSIRPGFSM